MSSHGSGSGIQRFTRAHSLTRSHNCAHHAACSKRLASFDVQAMCLISSFVQMCSLLTQERALLCFYFWPSIAVAGFMIACELSEQSDTNRCFSQVKARTVQDCGTIVLQWMDAIAAHTYHGLFSRCVRLPRL